MSLVLNVQVFPGPKEGGNKVNSLLLLVLLIRHSGRERSTAVIVDLMDDAARMGQGDGKLCQAYRFECACYRFALAFGQDFLAAFNTLWNDP
jgi:hypothetical protein